MGFNDLARFQITDEGDDTGQKIVKPESHRLQIPDEGGNGKHDLLSVFKNFIFRKCWRYS